MRALSYSTKKCETFQVLLRNRTLSVRLYGLLPEKKYMIILKINSENISECAWLSIIHNAPRCKSTSSFLTRGGFRRCNDQPHWSPKFLWIWSDSDENSGITSVLMHVHTLHDDFKSIPWFHGSFLNVFVCGHTNLNLENLYQHRMEGDLEIKCAGIDKSFRLHGAIFDNICGYRKNVINSDFVLETQNVINLGFGPMNRPFLIESVELFIVYLYRTGCMRQNIRPVVMLEFVLICDYFMTGETVRKEALGLAVQNIGGSFKFHSQEDLLDTVFLLDVLDHLDECRIYIVPMLLMMDTEHLTGRIAEIVKDFCKNHSTTLVVSDYGK